MTKMIMDLLPGVSGEQRAVLTEACLTVLENLGKLAQTVQAFEVAFVGGHHRHARITVRFTDPMGGNGHWRKDYLFSEGVDDTAARIANGICGNGTLADTIQTLLDSAHAKFQEAANKFAALETRPSQEG